MVFYLSIFIIVTYVLYLLLIGYFYYGWIKEPAYNLKNETSIPLSVIVPFRNENQNLHRIYYALKKQTLSTNLFEVYFINDHSTDDSLEILSALLQNETNFAILNSAEEGKKAAIKKAVEYCKYDYIVTTDADCEPNSDWLLYISNYLQNNNSHLLVGSVSFIKKKSWFSLFQHYEFLSLVISGAGAILRNKPIMCNAANLTFLKDLYLKAQPQIINEYASGDDIFLLHYAKKNHYKIDFLKSENSNVYTKSSPSLDTFFQQRIRWASKSKGYKDLFTILVAIIVFFVCILELMIPFLFYYNTIPGFILSLFIIAKTILDYKLIQSGSNFLGQQMKIHHYLSFAFLYPIYIVTTVLLSFLTQTRWKNRKI